MAIVAVLGDCTTTTAVALAATWPGEPPVILEADRSGGSLTAWLDTPATPTLSAIVSTVRSGGSEPTWHRVEQFVQRAASGVRFIAAPIRSVEANRAVAEAEIRLAPLLEPADEPTVIVDVGRTDPARPLPAFATHARSIVVVHRQHAASPAAAGVRLERCAELVESVAHLDAEFVIAIIGDRPFDADEIGRFVAESAGVDVAAWSLADDPLAAATLAGRPGLSARRLARQPLLRSAAELAAHCAPDAPSPDDVASTSVHHRPATAIDEPAMLTRPPTPTIVAPGVET